MTKGDVVEGGTLAAGEEAKLRSLGWAKEYSVMRSAPGRKLLAVTTPNGDIVSFTLTAELELIYQERVHFTVSVHEAKEGCNCGHTPGDSWQFSRCTPEGICSEAFHTMYPVIHGLTMGNGTYRGRAADETLVSCPDHGWVTFKIERRLWSADDWS